MKSVYVSETFPNVLKESPFCQALGITPMTRIAIFMMAHAGIEYTQTDLASFVGISRQTVYKAMEPLLRFGLVHKTRQYGNTPLFIFSASSDQGKALIGFNRALVDVIIEEEKDIEIPNQITDPAEFEKVLEKL